MTAGRITRSTVCQRDAPSVAAASSIWTSISSSTGCTVRTTNGSPTNIIATVTPAGANATLIPSGSRNRPSHPFSA